MGWTVEELTWEAFWNPHVPGCDEHYLIHIMRSSDSFIKELDFVADTDGKTVGNIVYAKSTILGDSGECCEAITFGPISVLPEYFDKSLFQKEKLSGLPSRERFQQLVKMRRPRPQV